MAQAGRTPNYLSFSRLRREQPSAGLGSNLESCHLISECNKMPLPTYWYRAGLEVAGNVQQAESLNAAEFKHVESQRRRSIRTSISTTALLNTEDRLGSPSLSPLLHSRRCNSNSSVNLASIGSSSPPSPSAIVETLAGKRGASIVVVTSAAAELSAARKPGASPFLTNAFESLLYLSPRLPGDEAFSALEAGHGHVAAGGGEKEEGRLPQSIDWATPQLAPHLASRADAFPAATEPEEGAAAAVLAAASAPRVARRRDAATKECLIGSSPTSILGDPLSTSDLVSLSPSSSSDERGIDIACLLDVALGDAPACSAAACERSPYGDYAPESTASPLTVGLLDCDGGGGLEVTGAEAAERRRMWCQEGVAVAGYMDDQGVESAPKMSRPNRMIAASDDGGGTGGGGASLLDRVITELWGEANRRGLFRYDLDTCASRAINGTMGFYAQLNEGRALLKRPTEYRVDQVCQPFDPAKFNFCKAGLKEVIIAFEAAGPAAGRPVIQQTGRLGASTQDHHRREAAAEEKAPSDVGDYTSRLLRRGQIDADSDHVIRRPNDGSEGGDGDAAAATINLAVGSNPNLVLINVSPIDFGHILLVPRVLDRLPQLLTEDTLLLALRFARESGNRYFRVGFNSLGGYATVNHLHFQAYFLDRPFACELAGTESLVEAYKRRRMDTTGKRGAARCVKEERKGRSGIQDEIATTTNRTTGAAMAAAMATLSALFHSSKVTSLGDAKASGAPGHPSSLSGSLVTVSCLAAPFPVQGFVLEVSAPPLAGSAPQASGGGASLSSSSLSSSTCAATAAAATATALCPPVSDAQLEALAAATGRACVVLQAHDVPHNILIAEAGRRLFLWPQRFAQRLAQGLVPPHVVDTGVNPAAFEIAGHVLLKRASDFAEMDEAAAAELLAQASLPKDLFLDLAAECFPWCVAAEG